MGKYTRTMAESLSMVSEVSNLDLMRKAAGGAMQTLKMKDGKVKMDSFTASGIMKVYDKVNAKNKKTIENMLATGRRADIMKLQKFAMSKVNAEYVPEELQEGTWKVPETRIDQMALRKVLRRPIKAKDAEKVMSQHIGDDELYDEFYELEKDDPNQDVRPLIRNRMKELGIKEEIELDERIDPADVDDDATDDDIKTRAQVILNGVKDLGLSNNPKILSIMQRIEKNIKDMGSVVPKESGNTVGSGVSKAGSSARSTLGELMLELGNVNSTIPGAMQFNRYDPSIRRRPSTLNSLGIPSR